MNIFKSIDRRLADIGFVKIEEDDYKVLYERQNQKYGFVHRLDICAKAKDGAMIYSYQKDVNNDGFNNCVGLTYLESKLITKKLISRRWSIRHAIFVVFKKGNSICKW